MCCSNCCTGCGDLDLTDEEEAEIALNHFGADLGRLDELAGEIAAANAGTDDRHIAEEMRRLLARMRDRRAGSASPPPWWRFERFPAWVPETWREMMREAA